jgi:hypothetical protein
LVIGVEAGPLISAMRSFSLAIFMTARATEVVTNSVAVSTPSRSNHSRALFEAMSALFWWSALTISILKSGFSLAMKVLDGHLRGEHCAGAGHVGIGAG